MAHSKLVSNIIFAIENHEKKIHANIDGWVASYYYAITLPVPIYLEVLHSLKAKGFNVSAEQLSLDYFLLNVMPTETTEVSKKFILENGVKILIPAYKDSDSLQGKDFNWLVNDPDLC